MSADSLDPALSIAPGTHAQPSDARRGDASIATRLPFNKLSARAVRGLLFDMGDTLYDATLWRRWLWQLLSRMGLHFEYACFFERWDRDYLGPINRAERDFQQSLRAFLLQVGLTRAQTDEVEAASQARRRELEAAARPLPSVRATLARLKQAGLLLGVLSDDDRPGEKLRQQLSAMRIGESFSVVISSFDMGRTQPDPACYQRALAALQLPAEQVLFVGHDPVELAGARATGMLTAAFNCGPDAVADAYLTRFDELLHCVPDRARSAISLRGAA